MKTLIKVLLLIGLLSFPAILALAEATAPDVFINKVHSTFELEPDSYSIELISEGLTTKDISENELKLKPLYNTQPQGRFTVVATVTQNGIVVEKRQVRLFIRKFANVVVAVERIGRFAEIPDNAVSVIRKDVTDLREQPLLTIEAVTGSRARRNLGQGAILTTADIEPIPAIKSHQDIHLVYVNGLCRVTSQGQALQDGRVGDYIKVKNKSSGKIVIARVVDEAAAAVGP